MRFLGIPVRFDFGVIVLGFIGSTIAGRIPGAESLPVMSRIFFDAVGAVVLILSILWHERGHIFAASRYGIGCSGIMLFAFGGMAFITPTPRTSREWFWIAIAGPIASFIAAAGFFAGYHLLDTMFPSESFVRQMLLTLALLNLILGSFNFIPVFPLDGGRVLYSILWRVMGDEPKARRLGIRIGRAAIIGIFVFVLVPLVLAGTLPFISFLWYLFIAFLVWRMQSSALDRPL